MDFMESEEAMTTLDQQAREAALLSTPLDTKHEEDRDVYDDENMRGEFVLGFLAGAEPRETIIQDLKTLAGSHAKEISILRARVAELEGMVPRWACAAESSMLEGSGWLRADDNKRGNGPRMRLMVPPISFPEEEK